MKYYLIVGEAKWRFACQQIDALVEKNRRVAGSILLGGDLMAAEGGTGVKHFKELAYMGFVPVLLIWVPSFRT